MNNKILFFLSVVILIISVVSAETLVPGGNVSGTWTAAGSPYLVQGNITVHADSTLNIEPGVEVNFQGDYNLTVNGLIEAVGTEADSIHFTSSTDWDGIIFSSAPDSSHLEYCILSAEAAFLGLIYCYQSNPVLAHCRISNNTSLISGGGITLESSSPDISYCTISGNSGITGGGIYCGNGCASLISHCNIVGNYANGEGGGIGILAGSNPVISNCTISDNESNWGGGIVVRDGGSCTITECILNHNSAFATQIGDGGGIYFSSPGGALTITNSTISNCFSNDDGGGIHIQSADSVSITGSTINSNYANGVGPLGCAISSIDCIDLVIDHCDVVNNGSLGGSGILLDGNTTLTLTNCIFRHQEDRDIHFLNYTSASVSYSDFYGSLTGPFSGSLPPGLGVITQTNTNGDPCDVFYNIYLDPLFVDFANGDYHLTGNSPCIDAGDPVSPFDPDSTITDMGRYFFDQRAPFLTLSDSSLNFGTVFIGYQADLPLTIFNTGSDTLLLYNIFCGSAVFTTNWNPAQNLILPGDSLEITITFIPVDTSLIVDTLLIESNDKSFQVGLSGKGNSVVGIEDQSELPRVYALYPAYPNPFNPSTTIEFNIPKNSFVTLKVYSILGQEVSILISKQMNPGKYKYIWNANSLASGIYFYRLTTNEFNKVKKIILLR